MKSIGIIAAFFGVLMIAPIVSAETYVEKLDPSGAPMCFDGDGNKAPLARCATRFETRFDPSGAPMCFDGDGNKAPLVRCAAQRQMRAQQETAVPPLLRAPQPTAATGDARPMSVSALHAQLTMCVHGVPRAW